MILQIMTMVGIAFLAWLAGYRSAKRNFHIFETKKERIYVAAALFVSITGLAIFQTVNNEPATVKSWDYDEWKAVIFCACMIVTANTLVTWLAYLSDPKDLLPSDERSRKRGEVQDAQDAKDAQIASDASEAIAKAKVNSDHPPTAGKSE